MSRNYPRIGLGHSGWHPKCGERALLRGERTTTCAKLACAIERAPRVVQPTKLEQCPAATELCVAELGSCRNDGVIFAQGGHGIAA